MSIHFSGTYVIGHTKSCLLAWVINAVESKKQTRSLTGLIGDVPSMVELFFDLFSYDLTAQRIILLSMNQLDRIEQLKSVNIKRKPHRCLHQNRRIHHIHRRHLHRRHLHHETLPFPTPK